MSMRTSLRVEWPTLSLALAIYASWALLMAASQDLPSWFVAAAGAWLVAWQGSLQHECVHGHPTNSEQVNLWVALWPLGLWLPYPLYRRDHRQHHGSADLTHPAADPESYFVSADEFERAGSLGRGVYRALHTLTGRLLLGPWVVVTRTALVSIRAIASGDREMARAWLLHGLSAIPVLCWLAYSQVSLLYYAVFIVYPSISLTLLRSFAEHRPAADPAHRTAIIESKSPLALLYLFNNLHVVHHAHPGLPWYEIPRRYAAEREKFLESNGGYLLPGYRALFSPSAPRQAPVHPATKSSKNIEEKEVFSSLP